MGYYVRRWEALIEDHAKRRVQLATPVITTEDRQLMAKALEGTQIAYGPKAKEFEQEVAKEMRAGGALAVTSGTAALHLALLAVGVQPEDQVLMPTLTFVAPAHATRYLGAEPLLFEVDPEYRQLDLERLAEWLDRRCELTDEGAIDVRTGRRIGAVVPVDLLGHPCDVDSLAKLVAPLKIPIVEDGAQGFGAKLRGEPIGRNAKVLCLSFNANKLITTGGGGMLLSDKPKLLETAEFLANQAKEGAEEYVHTELGFNYRLPAAPAALGLGQLSRLREVVDRKREIARHYEEALAEVPGLTMPKQAPWATAINWLFTIDVDQGEFGLDARGLMKALKDRHDVETRPIFTPLHLCGAYKGHQAHPCDVAERLAQNALSIPSSISLGEDELAYVCEAIDDVGRLARSGG